MLGGKWLAVGLRSGTTSDRSRYVSALPFGHTFVPRLLIVVSLVPGHVELLHEHGDLIRVAVTTVDEDVDAGAAFIGGLPAGPNREVHL